MKLPPFIALLLLALNCYLPEDCRAAILDKQKLLEAQTFWDNRDWDWYKAQIPFLETPDADIDRTYYYRWELITKHLTYGSPESGYSFTEFIDRPFWSGAYGAISCPAGHQIYETRWLHDSRYARDYARYWFLTPGAQPRNYSTWLADSVWALQEVHPDAAFVRDLLPRLVANFEGWEKGHWVSEAGLFWQIGHDDGMEFNINSRQTKDILRGAPGYRPSFNAYMWADARAIARMAELAGQPEIAQRFTAKAAQLKERLQTWLWDPKREFFIQRYKNDEEDKDGNRIRAGSFTYETGRFAGSPHGREEIGFVPWQFNLPDRGYETAWKFLMDTNYFFAEFGPLTVERHDPMYFLSKSCCWWSGMSWPYATTQTLKALANLLQNYQQDYVSPSDYLRLLQTYARTHRKNGKPYIAEAAHPDTGSWEGHDGYNHSEHYFHSGFADLVITGLIGLQARNDEILEVKPLAPSTWDYFALEDLAYHGRRITVLWDRTGGRYERGPGLHLFSDGTEIATSPTLHSLQVRLPSAKPASDTAASMNFAVNNEGYFYPKLTASYLTPGQQLSKLNDGNYWYHLHPPNRYAFTGSTNAEDWCELDFGTPRPIHTVKLYFLDDGDGLIRPPVGLKLEREVAGAWQEISTAGSQGPIGGHRATVCSFPVLDVRRLRVSFRHPAGGRTGLSEIEAWGPALPDYVAPPPPEGNLALNLSGTGFPKVSASYTSPYDQIKTVNDGRVFYTATPNNRWTTYGSTNQIDWLAVDFGKSQSVGRVNLHIYDDHGGVQAPRNYEIEYWSESAWHPVAGSKRTPAEPVGSALNTITFDPIATSQIRALFHHRGESRDRGRSGLTEIEIWER